jgi:hypothetical protein
VLHPQLTILEGVFSILFKEISDARSDTGNYQKLVRKEILIA